MSEKKLPSDKQLVDKVSKANGDYYAIAAEFGMRPYQVHDKVVKSSKDEALLGKVSVFREFGQRLQRARKFQSENVQLRRELRATTDIANLSELISNILRRTDFPKRKKNRKGKARMRPSLDTRAEWLFSDFHYGKKCDGYDVGIAVERADHYADEIANFNKENNPSRTTFAFIGDLIESTLKHRDSQSGSEVGTAEQVVGAFRCIRNFLRKTLPTAGEEINIVGVSGNHENPLGHGALMSWQGAHHLTFIIYSLLADEFQSDERIEWTIPRGNYALLEGTIYEHGDDVQPNDKAMSMQLVKRSRQVGEFCTRYRQGDKHVAVIADAGNLICNGAFFSDQSGTEFSGVKGYSSQPCQVGIINDETVRLVKF